MRGLRHLRPGVVVSLGLLLTGAAWADGETAGHWLDSDRPTQPGDLHPYGLNPLHPNTRSPSGVLYPAPRQTDEAQPWGTSGWLWRFSAQAGSLWHTASTDSARFEEYADQANGLALNRLNFRLEGPDRRTFVRVDAGAVARDDAHLRIAAGRYGALRVQAHYNQIPHVFDNNARVLWNGSGSGDLTLPAGLNAGTSSLDAVAAAFQAIPQTQLRLSRDQLGFSLALQPNRRWNLGASLRTESRDGRRAFGGTFGFPGNGQFMELVEPIDYRTTDVSLSVGHVAATAQWNLSLTGSYFRNTATALIWENPGLRGPGTPPQGRIALAPDNDYHHLKIEYAQALPWWRSRLTASAALSDFRQNDHLLPPTIRDQQSGSDIDFALWNETSALSRTRADAARQARLFRTQLTLNPGRKLRLSGKLRVRSEDNDTEYTAFNPLTGEFGYIALDGGIARVPNRSGIFQPGVPGSRFRIASIPFATDQRSAEVSASYRINRRYRLGANVGRDRREYQFREREQIDDDRIGVQLSRGGIGSLRVAVEHLRRSGDAYRFNPYEAFYSSSLPGYVTAFTDGDTPHTLADLRKSDLADQRRNTASLKSLWVLTDTQDLSINGSVRDEEYDAAFGLRDARIARFGVDWSWAPALHHRWSAYAHYQRERRSVRNINDAGGNAGSVSPDPFAGGAGFPLDAAWTQDVRERSLAAGVSFSKLIGKVELEVGYDYTDHDSEFTNELAGPAALAGGVPPDAAGLGFPDQRFRFHGLRADATWPINDRLRLRLLYRYLKEQLDDSHYRDLDVPLVPIGRSADIYLAAAPQSYTANVVGALFELRL